MADRILISRGTPPVKLTTGKSIKVPATKEQAYQVVDLAAPAGNAPADPAKLTKEGGDLVIKYPDGTQLTLGDFFVVCPGNACTVTLADGTATGQIVSAGAIGADAGGLGFWAWTGIIGGVGALAAAGGGGGGEAAPANPAPTLTGSTPTDGASSIAANSNISLTFSEAVVAGSGNIVISNGTDTRAISITDSTQVTISGNTVTINPTAPLQNGSNYNVQMAAGVLKDAGGASFAGITTSTALDFTTEDTTAPTLVSRSPADNATAVLVDSNIVLTFSKSVQAGTGNIVISNGTDTRTISVTDTTQVTISGSTVTINPTTDLQGNSHYSVQMASGVITDTAAVPRPFAGITTATALDFDTQDLSAPTLSSRTPADNASGVLVGSNIVLTFSEAVQAGSGTIEISNGTGDTRSISITDTNQVTINANTVTVNPTNPLLADSHYNVQIASGVIRDAAGNAFAGIVGNTALDFFTQDMTAPLLTGSTPADNATTIVSSSNIVLTFNEAVQAGTGNIVISNGTDTRTIGITDAAQVSISGNTVTINPTLDLVGSTNYNVQMLSGVIKDASGNSFAGIGSNTALNFAVVDLVAPTLVSSTPADDAAVVTTDADIVLTFSESVVAGSGSIVISDGTDTRTISVSSASQVAFSGNTVRINPTSDLNANTHYSVQMASGVIRDAAGNDFAGLTTSTVLDFDTTGIDLAAVSAGSGGFVISGQEAGENSGSSVSNAGDVNGDGLMDLVIGAPYGANGGHSYVVFGQTDGTAVRLSALGSRGFVINAQCALDNSGCEVSAAGDINGDGIADLLIGAHYSDPAVGDRAGRAYVVFGGTGNANVDLSALGSAGFVINGQAISDNAGVSVSSAGDVNGDGFADVIVGAYMADTAGGADAGRSYVVFGGTGISNVNLSAIANGNGGFVINGQAGTDYSGRRVSDAGDVNGDGLADLLVGAYLADSPSATDAGRAYLVFGKTTTGAVNLSAVAGGVGGFVINGQALSDGLGHGLAAAGDVNGDGLADIVAGAWRADPAGGANAGRSYVIFGRTGTASVDVSAIASGNGGGFVINGQAASDASGYSVSTAGDLNGDGLADLLISAEFHNGTGGTDAGRSYVVFGKTGLGAVELSAVAAGVGGFAINGQAAGDGAGHSVSAAGDVNGDGLADLVIGASTATTAAGLGAGKSYVIFGSTTGAFGQSLVNQYGTSGADTFTDGGTTQTLVTGAGDDTLTATSTSVLYGGAGDDLFRIGSATITALQNPLGSGGDAGRLVRVDGGTGIDTIRITGAGNTLDLTQVANQSGGIPSGGSRIDSVEKIDLTGTGNNTLVLSADDVRDIAGMNIFNDAGGWTGLGQSVRLHQLVVNGNAGDGVLVSGNWLQISQVDSGGQTYKVYRDTANTAQLLVDSDVTVTAAAGVGNSVTVNAAPTLSSTTPTDNAVLVLPDGNIQLTFSEPVVRGSGSIIISNGTDTRVIDVADTSQVPSVGSTVTINPTTNLQGNSEYRLEISPGAFIDAAGSAYVGIHGSAALTFSTASVDLSVVAGGKGGFVINEQAVGDGSGTSVSSAGDVNGDGLDDLIVGAPGTSVNTGRTYVVFGQTGTAAIDLSAVAAGVGGYAIDGQVSGDFSGKSVSSVGDINGDGLVDLIVGAYGSASAAGRSYVVLGKTGTAAVQLSAVEAGSGGFVINGQAANNLSGISVSGAGDVNGDGLADVIVGAYGALSYSGRSYVVFGKSETGAINLSAIAAGSGGFVMNGAWDDTYSGVSVSGAGDVNGDGFADLVVGASGSGSAAAGRGYVVFGKTDTAALNLAALTSGGDGFVINGISTNDSVGRSVSSAGDVNGDGLGDVVISGSNGSYVVFGRTDSVSLDLSTISTSTSGFAISGGGVVSGAGDINGDGLADLIVGSGGSSYVVFGKTGSTSVSLQSLAGSTDGLVINGAGSAVASAGDVNGDGLADLMVGGYVIFGSVQGAFAQTRVDQYGTAGADVFTDGGTAQTLVTGLGDDMLTASAASVLYGGGGSDTFTLGAGMVTALQNVMGAGGNVGQLARVSGGAGIDKLALSGGGLTLNLTQVANQSVGNADGGSRIDSVELIDLTGSGNNTLVLSAADIRDMAAMNIFNDGNGWAGLGATVRCHQLVVGGNTGDSLTATGLWLGGGTVSAGGQTYSVFNDVGSAAQLLVDTDVGVTIDFEPTLISSIPADSTVAVSVNSPIVLTFSEAVTAGAGNIVISNGIDTRMIAASDAQVQISGDTVTITPDSALQENSHYSVQMAKGVIRDASGNDFPGITAAAPLDFYTAGPVVAPVELSALVGSAGGLMLNGSLIDAAGFSISGAGDVNGDGRGDYVVGAYGGYPDAGPGAGRSYVVFGTSASAAIDLSAVAGGSGGFVLNGASRNEQSGFSVSGAGDVNGDGRADLIVGAWQGTPGTATAAGRSYVIFGKTDTAAVELSAVGTKGFVINGQSSYDNSGFSVSGAGDVNGDGLADVIVGAPESASGSNWSAGRSYVVFGRSGNVAVELSALGTNGLVINGHLQNDNSGASVAGAGDVNGDGLADLIVGAPDSDSVVAMQAGGRGYVVFGRTTTGTIDLSSVASGVGGFVLNAESAGDRLGVSVADAGDVNGDGLADLIVGAKWSDAAAGTSAGRSYVVFGKTTTTAVNLSAVAAGTGGFVINGQASADLSGISVAAAGDINGDGLADVIVGASLSDTAAGADAGRSYVVFGKSGTLEVNLSAVAAGIGGFAINGSSAGDYTGRSVSGAGDINGDGLADLIIGAPASDPDWGGTSAGHAYVIFGSTGGTFLETSVDQYGTSGADSFSDGGLAKTLVTGQGDDTLTATAASVLYGGAGNDTFVIDSAMITALQSAMGSGGNTLQLARIDGGSGIDTISLAGSGLTLNLAQVANQAGSNVDGGSRIDSIEKIDLTGTGNNTLVLQLRDVLDMGSANTFVTSGRQQLLVTGNAGDTVDFADSTGTTNWTQSGTASISAVTYNVWNHNTSLATVYVNTSVAVI